MILCPLLCNIMGKEKRRRVCYLVSFFLLNWAVYGLGPGREPIKCELLTLSTYGLYVGRIGWAETNVYGGEKKN